MIILLQVGTKVNEQKIMVTSLKTPGKFLGNYIIITEQFLKLKGILSDYYSRLNLYVRLRHIFNKTPCQAEEP